MSCDGEPDPYDKYKLHTYILCCTSVADETHAAWLYNHLPNKSLGWMSPLVIFTKTQSDHCDFLGTIVWGCPAFLLHPKLQYGQKIPKFNEESYVPLLGFQ